MTVTKYFSIGKINFINSFTYTLDIFAHSLFIGLILFIFISLWKVVFSGKTIIDGFTINMMVWYVVMTESIITSQRHIVEEIGNEIKSGEIANYLNKPYNYVLYKYFSSIGSSVFRFFLTFVVAGIVVIIFLGGIKVSVASIPFILLSAFLAITLQFFISAFIGLFAFWFEDSKGMDFIYQKIVFTIGGMLMPLDIFPFWLQKISKVLPFSYTAYHPAKLFVNFEWQRFFSVIKYQLMWVVIFCILIALLYRICVRRVSVNGG